jgi:hypothetical protein
MPNATPLEILLKVLDKDQTIYSFSTFGGTGPVWRKGPEYK